MTTFTLGELSPNHRGKMMRITSGDMVVQGVLADLRTATVTSSYHSLCSTENYESEYPTGIIELRIVDHSRTGSIYAELPYSATVEML